MKPHFQTFPHLQVLGRALLAAVAVLALWTAQLTAGDEKSAPASILSKLDKHLVLVVKKSRGESPFDKPTTLQPDVYQFKGRVLVEIEGSASKELSDQVTSPWRTARRWLGNGDNLPSLDSFRAARNAGRPCGHQIHLRGETECHAPDQPSLRNHERNQTNSRATHARSTRPSGDLCFDDGRWQDSLRVDH